MMPPMRILVSLLSVLLLSCTSSFGEGVAHYGRAEYPQAIERFVGIEDEVADWAPKDRAHYALYRGLTHFALGNRVLAKTWLGEAKAAYDADPSVFSDADAGKLSSAWAHLPRDPMSNGAD